MRKFAVALNIIFARARGREAHDAHPPDEVNHLTIKRKCT